MVGTVAGDVPRFLSDVRSLSGSLLDSSFSISDTSCAKRWQTRECTYQLKRRRLKPDVRDPPEDRSVDLDMADICTMDGVEATWWKRIYEGLRGARFVSPCLT